MTFTEQQVDQHLLPCQSVTPRETHNGANDPRDAVPCERQQGHHGAAASPRRRRGGAHSHALGEADVNGEEGVHRYPLERRVQLHAVLFRHLSGLSPVFAAAVGGFFIGLAALVLYWTRSPAAPSAFRGSGAAATATAASAGACAGGLLVQGHELGSAQDTVPLPSPGSHIVSRGHVWTWPVSPLWLFSR